MCNVDSAYSRHVRVESNKQRRNAIGNPHGPAVRDQIQQPKEACNKQLHRAFNARCTKGSQTSYRQQLGW